MPPRCTTTRNVQAGARPIAVGSGIVLAVDDLPARKPAVRALPRLGRALVGQTCASFRQVPERIVLDIDDNFDGVHDSQQLRVFDVLEGWVMSWIRLQRCRPPRTAPPAIGTGFPRAFHARRHQLGVLLLPQRGARLDVIARS